MRGEVSTGHTDSRIPQEGRSLLRKVITSQRLTLGCRLLCTSQRFMLRSRRTGQRVTKPPPAQHSYWSIMERYSRTCSECQLQYPVHGTRCRPSPDCTEHSGLWAIGTPDTPGCHKIIFGIFEGMKKKEQRTQRTRYELTPPEFVLVRTSSLFFPGSSTTEGS